MGDLATLRLNMFKMAASTAAAVTKGFSMGTKCVPSMMQIRPLVIFWVKSDPANRISLEWRAATKLTGQASGCFFNKCSRLCGKDS